MKTVIKKNPFFSLTWHKLNGGQLDIFP